MIAFHLKSEHSASFDPLHMCSTATGIWNAVLVFDWHCHQNFEDPNAKSEKFPSNMTLLDFGRFYWSQCGFCLFTYNTVRGNHRCTGDTCMKCWDTALYVSTFVFDDLDDLCILVKECVSNNPPVCIYSM